MSLLLNAVCFFQIKIATTTIGIKSMHIFRLWVKLCLWHGTLKVHQIAVKRLLLYDLKCHQITWARLVMFILIYLAIVGCVSSSCQNEVKKAFILSSSDNFIACLSAWRISLIFIWMHCGRHSNSRSLCLFWWMV